MNKTVQSHPESSGSVRSAALWLLAGLIAGLSLYIPASFAYGEAGTEVLTVRDKFYVESPWGGLEYRIRTGEGTNLEGTHTFTTHDHWVNDIGPEWSDLFESVQVGKEYKMTYYGWDIPLTPLRRTLVSAVSCKSDDPSSTQEDLCG